MAAQRGHIKCIKLLLSRGADPHIKVHNIDFNVYSNALDIAFLLNNYKCYYLMKKYIKNQTFLRIESPLLCN